MIDHIKTQLIDVAEIYSDPDFNVRGRINPSSVVELRNSIASKGLLQPLTVQPYHDPKRPQYKYRIIIGHRRFEAIKMLGWKEVMAAVKHDLTETDAMILNFVENLDRKDLNILQEAHRLKRFFDADMTLEEIAKKIGKSKGWVNIRLSLLKLPGEIQEEAAAGTITQEQVRDIATMRGKEAQFGAVRKIKESRLRGEKRALKIKEPKHNLTKRKPRSIQEIQRMNTHLLETIGESLVTRALAWATGVISTLELYKDIMKYAEENAIRYSPPKEAQEVFSLSQ